ncbi:hypothetical protein NP493_954g00001 [Ridgeia piscesae]|uniref:G patch domain-containing protein 4 n=1 Tax=Ridgeia piscesae TaxID=27915 RepID=A0AAD9KJD6_RIDPI|nr:hypothetical protein NP493_954g00001 [Ridgeia piscesae]
MIQLNKKCFDPQSHLEKHGWQRGSGLGRSEDGIKEAIKVKIKNDTTGVGHDPGKEFSYHWWDHVFNKAASRIQVHNTEEGVRVTRAPAKSKKVKRKDTRDVLYGNFVKASTLTCNADGVVETKVERESSDSEDDTSLPRCTDKELFKLCGSRTAHKGARHGLKLSGKLQRLEEQERLAAETELSSQQERPPAENTSSDPAADVSRQRKKKKKKDKKRKVADEGNECSNEGHLDSVNELHVQKDELCSRSKKHKKQNATDSLVESSGLGKSSKRKKKRKKEKGSHV